MRAEVEVALLPPHHGRIEHGQQRHPRAGVGRRATANLDIHHRHRAAHLDGGAAVRRIGQHREDRGSRAVEPLVAVVGDPGADHVPGHPGALGSRDPGGGAGPGRRQQVAGEDEQGAPHGQLLHQGSVAVERPVDVGDPHVADPRPGGQVHGRRLGGVQHRHRGRRGLRGADAERRGHRVPDGQPGAALIGGHVAHRDTLTEGADTTVEDSPRRHGATGRWTYTNGRDSFDFRPSRRWS